MARRAKGEGGLYQAKDKSWIYQYRVDGQRKSKRFKRKSDALAYMKAMAAGGPTQSPEESEPPAPPVQETVPAAPAKARQAKAKPEAASTGATHAVGKVTPAVFQHMTPQVPGVSEVITLGDWMDRWLEDYARPTVKLSTYSSYEMYIRRHIKPNIGGLYMSSIRVDDMQAFFNERGKKGNLVSGEGLSPKTLLNMRNMMHLAFTQAVRNKLAFDNPIEGVRIPKLVKTEMRVLTREEQDRLITATRFAPEPAAFGIVFDIFTGLRLGELCGLRWANVDMGNRSFTVCETRNRLPNHDPTIAASTSVKTEATTKTENSRRTVYLIDSLYQDFVMYKQIQDSITQEMPGYNPDGYVFCQPCGRPYEPRTYQDLFKRCVKQAGIRDANFHALRHTFATRSLEEGMDVVTLSRILGHATPSITMDKYGHALDDHKRTSMEKLGSLYNGASTRYKRDSHAR